jgi:2-polyprenyl-3-methyl-5-hydroxy-6-metoxy-1,4-benzoquinol methylase
MTLDYYNTNAEAFRQRTAGSITRRFYEPFLALLRPGAHILDAGCGPGRDSRQFVELGYRVTAMDASTAMVEMASKAIGQPVLLRRFQDVEFDAEFDGIWANASLLHVPAREFDDVLRRLARALKPGGVLYMSLKIGDGERIHDDGRFFCDYSESSLRAVLANHPTLELLSTHQTPPSPGQADGRAWLHAIVKKTV